MLKTEKRTAFSLALIYGFRMLGLFMVLPVFSLYAETYENSTPLLMGLAIGIYGLTQGLFQLPFGMLSDRFGRKKLIVIGLMLFCAGSLVAGYAETINEIILGRALQGMGAIAAVVMALAADLSREEIRVRMMAIIGMSIGVSFVLSMILGPLLASSYGLGFIFQLSGGLAIIGIFVVIFITPSPNQVNFHRDTQLSPGSVGAVFKNRSLLRLDLSVFVLHLILSATFVVFPLILRDALSIPVDDHWKTYVGVFCSSIILMVPLILVAEKYQKVKLTMIVAGTWLMTSLVGIGLGVGYSITFLLMVFYFAAFNFLEAVLPSQVARIAAAGMKGTAMGIFSSSQFFGTFCGGVLGGYLFGRGGVSELTIVLIVILAVWIGLLVTYDAPKPSVTKSMDISHLDQTTIAILLEQINSIRGVLESTVYDADGLLYLKLEKQCNQTELDELISQYKN